MEVVSSAISVAQNLLQALKSSELKEILSIFGYKSQLADLQRTVSTINEALCDAETKEELTNEAQHWIKELKEAVFEADDLFDEFVTLAEQKQLVEASGSLSKKVSHFFSLTHNPLNLAYRMSRGVKGVNKKLEKIATNCEKFSFKIDSEPIRKRRPESCSYVNEVDIIGRQDDLDHIVSQLLATNDQHAVSFLSIVGIGGLGKTALAQLVYNDPRVTSAFPLQKWTCVADQDQWELNVKEILGKILGSDQVGSTMDQVQSQVRAQLDGKKFLLVLDDVWTESRGQWCGLLQYLTRGERGSWIVVTTRSQETATIIGGLKHELQGLSKENSWLLFGKTAFLSDENPPDELVKIGREIVDGCARVPLALRVVGSLLYGQDMNKWRLFQKIGIANMRGSKDGIMPILKLSFHHLDTPLKSCFSYCALFPKDFKIEKHKLISLWMAQGYVIPLNEGQSVVELAEEYFSILLRRCFFQDIEEDFYGEIESCKIHDLMHDVAQSVSGKEIMCATNIISDNVIKEARHLLIAGERSNGVYSLGKTSVRSHLFVDYHRPDQFQVESLLVNYRCLRALDLSDLMIESLPDSIGELIHLRYLDLSENKGLEVIPKSITKLYNLQTLLLSYCESLEEWPKDMSKLVKLKVLDIGDCYELRYMPRDMRKLSSLERLSDFIVGGDKGRICAISWKQMFDGLEDLNPLNNLKGRLCIQLIYPENAKYVVEKDNRKKGLFLVSKEYLNHIIIHFVDERMSDGDEIAIMRLMEELQPHSNLKQLDVRNYTGMRMPGWINHLPNLVELSLWNCKKLEYLPQPELGSTAEQVLLFPSLEKLELEFMPKLKGWRREEEESNNNSRPLLHQLLLPSLSKLTILHCPELVGILICPRLELKDQKLSNINKKLRIIKTMKINSQPMEGLQCIETPKIEEDKELVDLPNLDAQTHLSQETSKINEKWPRKTFRRFSRTGKAKLKEASLPCIETLKIEEDKELVDLPKFDAQTLSQQTFSVGFFRTPKGNRPKRLMKRKSQ